MPVVDSSAFYEGSYEHPFNGTVVDQTRDTSEFLRNSVAVYVFAITTYAHFLSLTRSSRFWTLEALEVFVFACFPALPLVQSIYHAHEIIFKILAKRGGGFRYYFAAWLGFYAQTVDNSTLANPSLPRVFQLIDVGHQDLRQASAPTLQSFKSWQQIGRLAAIIASFIVSLLSSIGYIRRLLITHNNNTYVAALGIDHRLGWLELGSLWTCVLSLFAMLMGKGWQITNSYPQNYCLATSSKMTMALYIIFAKLVQVLLVLFTTHILMRPKSFTNYLFWLHQLGLVSDILGVLNNICKAYGFWKMGPNDSFLLLPLSLSMLPFPMLQAMSDYTEVKEIKANILRPWNYRWMEKDKLVLNWWII